MRAIRSRSAASSRGKSCAGRTSYICRPTPRPIPTAGYKPNILFRSADTESILMMVAAEEGISLLPDYCTDRLYNADNLVFVPLVGEGEEEEIIAAWQSGNQNPALGRFLTELNQKDPPY